MSAEPQLNDDADAVIELGIRARWAGV